MRTVTPLAVATLAASLSLAPLGAWAKSAPLSNQTLDNLTAGTTVSTFSASSLLGMSGCVNIGAYNSGCGNIGAFNGNQNTSTTSGNFNIGALNGNQNTGASDGNANIGAGNGNKNSGSYNGNGNVGGGNGNSNGGNYNGNGNLGFNNGNLNGNPTPISLSVSVIKK